MTDSQYDGNRKGSITKEKAVDRFNEYYETRANSSIGRFRAKLFDMMYQKKPSKTLTPDQPGSERYLLEEGPRTFDMKGVDWFQENEEFAIHGEPNTNKYKSKGSTYKKNKDEDNTDIYGPRLDNNSKTLYSSHFKSVYDDRALLEKDTKGSLRGKNLIDIYWNKYRNGDIKRKNLKTNNIHYYFNNFSNNTQLCSIDLQNNLIYYKESGQELDKEDSDIQLFFLTKLKLLIVNNSDEYILNKKFKGVNILKVIVEVSDMTDTFYYRLSDGMVVEANCESNKNAVSLYLMLSPL